MAVKSAYGGNGPVKITASPDAANKLTKIFPASGVAPSISWEGRGQYAAQFCVGMGYKKLGNVLVTNHAYAPLIGRVRNCSRLSIQLDDSIYGITGHKRENHYSKNIVPRPPDCGFAIETTMPALAASFVDPAVITPSISTLTPLAMDLDPTVDHYFAFTPVNTADIVNGTSQVSSMKYVSEGGAEGMLALGIIGFVTNAGATFEVVDWPTVEFPMLDLGDSNDDGHLEPEAGDETTTRNEPRNSLQTLSASVDSHTWAKKGVLGQFLYRTWTYVARNLGMRLAPCWAAFGGRWQAGVMDADWKALWTGGVDALWPDLFENLSPSAWRKLGNSDTDIDDAGNVIGGARFLSQILNVSIGSHTNDQLRDQLGATLRALPAYSTLADVFDGSAVKDSLGKKAGAAGLVAKILAAIPNTTIFSHFGPQTDAGLASAPGGRATTTKASMKAAMTGVDANYYRMAPGQADASFGLCLDVADAAISTLTNNGTKLHFNKTDHAAIFNWMKDQVQLWYHTAVGAVFVDSVGGSDSNAGTYAAPKKTIAAAGSSWKWLCLKAGSVFTEKLTIPASGASSSVPLRILTYGEGAQAIISGSAGARDCVLATARSDVWFQNIHLDGGIVGLNLATSATRIKLSNVTISNCTSHGISASVTGSGNVLESCTIHHNAGTGVSLASSVAFTTYRNNIYANAHGIQAAGTVTFTGYADWIHGNIGNQFYSTVTTGGAVILRNAVLVASAATLGGVAEPTTSLIVAACFYCTGTSNTLQHCLLVNGAAPGTIVYAICAVTSAARITWENCAITGTNDPLVPYVRVEAVGATGSIVAARNNVYDDHEGTAATDVKFVRWASGTNPGTNSFPDSFAAWQANLNRSSAAIENASVFDSLLMLGNETDLDSDPALGRPAVGSAATGIAVNLTGTFSNDYKNRTRPTTSDVGAFIIAQ